MPSVPSELQRAGDDAERPVQRHDQDEPDDRRGDGRGEGGGGQAVRGPPGHAEQAAEGEQAFRACRAAPDARRKRTACQAPSPSPSTTCAAPIATANSSSGSSASADGPVAPQRPVADQRACRGRRRTRRTGRRRRSTSAAPAAAIRVRPASAGARLARRPASDERERDQHDAVADVSDHRAEHQRQEERHQQRRIDRAGARQLEEAARAARTAGPARELCISSGACGSRGDVAQVLDEHGGAEP